MHNQQSLLEVPAGPAPATPVRFLDPPGHDAGTRHRTVASPLGPILLTGDGHVLTRITLNPEPDTPEVSWVEAPNDFTTAVQQLTAYFTGDLHSFDLALAPAGTSFQRRVWQQLTTVAYGHTTNYGALAAQLGQPTAARAVGMANGRNPLPIVVPCHRIIGADGGLTGYSGGLDIKRKLLRLENRHSR